ncbi:MAG: P-loop NTPase [Nanohaloarchaea archaeon]|nr:P-loop NTPase [Candidatus Nanohaloarchaea archaeon]
MAEVISIISGKGGVGKTTLTANLADALSKKGKSTLVIDANISGANMGIHLNMLESGADLNSVLSGKDTYDKAIYAHPYGFHVMPSSINVAGPSMHGFSAVISNLVGHYDYILVDTAAGTDDEVKEAVKASDSVLIVTNPDIPAVSNAALVKRLTANLGKPIKGVVLNMARGEYLELTDKQVSEFMDADVISKIPFHKNVKQSTVFGKSVIDYSPRCPPSIAISSLAGRLCGEEPKNSNFLSSLASKIPGLNR